MVSNGSPFYSICFLLPMLCQITLETGGCKILASSGAFREVSLTFVLISEINTTIFTVSMNQNLYDSLQAMNMSLFVS